MTAPHLGTVTPAAGSMLAIAQFVAFETGVSIEQIRGPNRDRPSFRARMYVCWGARVLLGRTTTQIGRFLGHRDHSTIVSALARAEALLDSDPAFARVAGKLRRLGGVSE